MDSERFINRAPEMAELEKAYQTWQDSAEDRTHFWALTGPKGAGKSRVLEEVHHRVLPEIKVFQFSFLEAPLFPQLWEGLGWEKSLKEISLEELFSRWLVSQQEKTPDAVAIFFKDLQEIENIERSGFFNILSFLQECPGKLLVILEADESLKTLIPNKIPIDTSISLKSMKPGDINKILENNTPPTGSEEWCRGLPQRARWLKGFLEITKDIQAVPSNEKEFNKILLKGLTDLEIRLLQTFGLHPSWVSFEFLEKVSGIPKLELNSMIKTFSLRSWLKSPQFQPERSLFAWEPLAQSSLEQMKPEERKAGHRRCYQFLLTQSEWFFRSSWLAYHAAGAGMPIQAFRYYLGAASGLMGRSEWVMASYFIQCAERFAESKFKKSYALSLLGECYSGQRRFDLAIQALQSSLLIAKEIDWPEHIQWNLLQLGNFHKHLGLYPEAEKYFREAIQAFSAGQSMERQISARQKLGICLLERGKYPEAREVFEEILQYFEKHPDPLGILAAKIPLVQIQIALGKGSEAKQSLRWLEDYLSQKDLHDWEPLILLLRARLFLSQGNHTAGIKVLEEAALGFETLGDMGGKVEVLLAMSAPLLEHNLLKEAEDLISFLAEWEGLDLIPGLKHSIQLRRLAIGAFSGVWKQEDLDLTRSKVLEIGRQEDWWQFWFHLALAAERLKEDKRTRKFIKKAMAFINTVADRLNEVDRQTFLARSDIARIHRLSGEGIGKVSQSVKGDREMMMEGPAEAATLSPPVKEDSKDSK